eukprot:m.104544 g.104544  ORF g.104544 m.104544 type:complete len:211 (-) comp20950_c0_seq1:2538-3170(-)
MSAPGAVAVVPPDNHWICKSCTFQNKRSAAKCKVCLTAKASSSRRKSQMKKVEEVQQQQQQEFIRLKYEREAAAEHALQVAALKKIPQRTMLVESATTGVRAQESRACSPLPPPSSILICFLTCLQNCKSPRFYDWQPCDNLCHPLRHRRASSGDSSGGAQKAARAKKPKKRPRAPKVQDTKEYNVDIRGVKIKIRASRYAYTQFGYNKL